MLQRRLSVLVALAAALGATACGMGGPGADQPEPARLEVWEALPLMPIHAEGSLSYLKIERADGEVVVEGAMTGGMQERGREPLFEEELAPGKYRLRSFQRPCQGNCEHLDRPSNECARTLQLEPGEELRATVVLGPRDACSIELRQAAA